MPSALEEFLLAEHQVDDEGNVPHERMAGYTMEQIMSGTGLKHAALKQQMLAAEAHIEHYTHPTLPTLYARKGMGGIKKMPQGYSHNHGLDFGEE